MATYDKIETDNPLLDEIVHNCKLLMSTCILKDEKSADNAETVESLRNANTYLSIIEGRCKYEYFSYSMAEFIDLGIGIDEAKKYVDGIIEVPTKIKAALLKNKIEVYKYVELNDYYRKLLGLPNIEEKDKDFVYLTKDDMQSLPIEGIDIKIPVHLQSDDIKFAIESYGVLQDLIERHPDKYYLKNINKHIDIYLARKAAKYGLIYVSSEGVEPALLSRFKELIEKNRVYIMKTMDFESYDFYSDYYERFVMMMIIVQTVIDMINELPDYYIRRDIFDIRTIEYFFESNGVEFFPNIPLKYQKILVKNLNRLIKYKSTNTNIVDICSLFGFSNIEIFKYYLCKNRATDANGEYVDTGIPDEDYELKFLKVPLNDLADETAKDKSNFMIYETVVDKDKYWNGPYDHDYVKQKILEHEFNMVRSKYISIDTVYSLTDASFELSYFINMLMFNKVSKSKLNLNVPIISQTAQVNLVDVFIFLYALMYEYNGVTDNIIIEPSGYLKIKGFNFDANMNALAAYIATKGYTLKDLGVSGFQIPSGGILTFNQLVAIFINNREIYDHLVYEMEHADNKEIYLIYKYIYDSLMLTDLNFEYYYLPQLGRVAETYTEFLQYKEPILYDIIQNIREEEDEQKRSTKIYNMITNVSSYITKYLGSPQLNNIFINMPTESGEYVKNYMYKIINFFKSFKISILDIQTIYKLDKENKVFMFDDVFYQYYFIKKQVIDMIDKAGYNVDISRKDQYDILDDCIFKAIFNTIDNMNIEEKTAGVLASMTKSEINKIVDKFKSFKVSMNNKDKTNIVDSRYRYNYVYDWAMQYEIIDTTEFTSIFNTKDKMVLKEVMRQFRIYLRKYNEPLYITLLDRLNFIANISRKDKYNIEDYAFINPVH